MAEIFAAEFESADVFSFIKNMESRLRHVENGHKKYIGLLSSIVWRDINQHFKDQAGPDGKWQKWSKSYSDHMNRIGRGSNNILQFDGRLRNNFKPTSIRKIAGGLLWFNNAKTASGFPYAYAHDNDSDSRKQLPRRQFMWLSKDAMGSIEENTTAFMLEENI